MDDIEFQEAKQKASPDPASISIELEGKETLRIERDGTIIWKEGKCENFKDLAKAFMYNIFKMSPQVDWRGVAPEIYEEIKHLIVEKKS